ncbi:hypothetical protein IMZ11_15660 [Microtetraspora sp. AC03309]|uniref:DUF4288 domain-containing protein n=1 Tax=Microtetraspora sp. AC03309 TaxID=2779376 RepID=UPI001E50E42D|nr:DUF4288 domain-containing protein [Microtetraspora sp. AC03309]MCC5577062.1 hypothetical protein [Microtetraspora sp. AC03309]
MNETPETGWYAVRCVFRWRQPYDTYEERLTLWRADSFDEAIAMAEREAEEYVDDRPFEYLGLAQAYYLDNETISSGTEIFSLLRDSDLDPEEYLDTFFDTGRERHGHIS